jgi:membrane peptidoglycan carboxypeptidase
MLAFVSMSGLGGVLAAGLVMPAVATTSVVTDTSVRLFDDLPSELDQVQLSEKSTIYAADGTLLATFFRENRIVVPLSEISPMMQHAVIAVEDHRFYEHGGIDPTGLLRAIVQNATDAEGEVQGGSTLTQQYVKNMLIQAALESDDPLERAQAIEAARTAEGTAGYARKLAEAKMAIALEQRLSKDEILERYLNIAQFGKSVYGVEAAAQYFFSVPAAEVNYLQAATIAGVTAAPSQFDPELNPEESEGRRNIVLRAMRAQGFITEAEYQQGRATPLVDTLAIGQVRLGCMAANDVANAGYFCDYVTKIISQDPVFGETQADRARLLYRGGLTITTTLDVGLQAAADQEVKAGIPVGDPSGVASAISVVEPGTGKVLAMAQNRIYNSAENSGPGETAVNFNTDNQYGSASGFAPGSTFKPFTLLEWFKQGHGLSEMVDGTVRLRNENEFVACGGRLASRPWPAGNADGGRGVMTVLDATRGSVNNAYLSIASQLDLCAIMAGAEELGIHKAGGQAGDGPFDPIPANVLGSQSVAPLTMAAAFAAFAANGTFCDPIAITSVVNSDGEQLPVPQANCRVAMSPEIAAAINYTLSQVWQGTGRSIGALPGRPSAGKTGTTSANEYTWFVGYTPQISTAVWVGYSEGMIPVQGKTINGRWYRNVYGSTIAGPTWKRFMVRAHEGREVIGFPPPSARQLGGLNATVPSVVGRSVEDATNVLKEAGFNIVVGPTELSTIAAPGTVTRTSPGAGSSVTRGTVVTLVLSGGPPPAPPPADPPGCPGPGPCPPDP